MDNEVFIRILVIVNVVILFIVLVYRGRRKILKLHHQYGRAGRDALLAGKIIVSFLQINLSMPSMMSTFQFPEAYIAFLNRMNFLNIDMLSILGAQCVFDVDFRYSMLGSLMIPIVVVCTTGIFYACKSAGIHSNMKTMTTIEQMKTYGRLFDLGDYNESGSIDFEVSGGFVVVLFF